MPPWDGWRAKCNDSGVVLTARIILFGLVLAELTDALTFTIGVSRFGIGLESNGFAATMFQSGGLASVLVLKGGVLLATIAILVATAEDFPRLLVWGARPRRASASLGSRRTPPRSSFSADPPHRPRDTADRCPRSCVGRGACSPPGAGVAPKARSLLPRRLLPRHQPPAPSAPSSSPEEPVATVMAVGDIAGCDWETDSATAALVEGRDGMVLTLGDNVYPAGSDDTYAACYDPAWGASSIGRCRRSATMTCKTTPAPPTSDTSAQLPECRARAGTASISVRGIWWR